MSEQAPAEQDTPTPVDASQEDVGSQQTPEQVQAEIDYRKRYEDMRPEFDRKSQRLAEAEQRNQWLELLATTEDPDTRRQAAQALGFEIADEEDPLADPNDQLTQRLEALEQRYQQQAQQAEQAQQIAQIEAHVEQQLAGLDGLDDADRKWIVNTAVAMPATPEGMPDIRAAYDEFVAWETGRQKKWAQTKRAHPFSSVGAEGTQQPDLKTRQGKVDFIQSRLAADEM